MPNQFHVHSNNLGISSEIDCQRILVKRKHFIIVHRPIHSKYHIIIDVKQIKVRLIWKARWWKDVFVFGKCRCTSDLFCSFYRWKYQLYCCAKYRSTTICLFCKSSSLSLFRANNGRNHCLWFSLTPSTNVRNNTFHRLKFISLLMIPVEIYWQENPPWYWMSFQVIHRRRTIREHLNLFFLHQGTSGRHYESIIQLPDWIHGRWFTMGTSGINTNTVDINNTQLMMKINDEQALVYDLRFTRIMSTKRQQDNIIRIKAKSLEQW